jgi:hypothetical protein
MNLPNSLPELLRGRPATSFAHRQSVTVIGGHRYLRTPYGLKQLDVQKIVYDPAYIATGSRTTPAMCELRLAFLREGIADADLATWSVLELGPGNGCFFRFLAPQVAHIDGYDVAQTSYSTIPSLAGRPHYQLVCGFDVLEHFEDIDELWQLDFTYGLFSLPCPPRAGVDAGWRHFKPHEHLWHITPAEFTAWMRDHGYEVLRMGSPEDALRTRWDPDQVNIASFVVKRSER